jgi:hypothetical protein
VRLSPTETISASDEEVEGLRPDDSTGQRYDWPVPRGRLKRSAGTTLTQAGADITKRLAVSTALPVFRKDLLPLIAGVVVVVNLAMGGYSSESVWNGDTFAIATPLSLRTVLSRVGLPVKPLARPSWGMG